MSVVIEVASIVTPDSRRRPGPRELHQSKLDTVAYISDFFKWETIPWNEPSEQFGIFTSASNSRFNLLLSLAWLIDQNSDEMDTEAESYFTHLFNVLPKNIRGLSEYQYFPPSEGFNNFSHLLSRNIFTSYWFPLEIANTVHIDAVLPDGFSIGSSHRLRDELHNLGQITQQVIALNGKDSPIQYLDYSITWDSVHQLIQLIENASDESISLNLPLKILW